MKQNHRSFFVVVGDRGREQIPNLHYVLNKASAKRRSTALWCYKNELGFSTHRQKRAREIKKLMQRGLYDPSKEDPFELFVASTKIRWCYYKDTKSILGSTVSLLVLQDFEAITPNLLARAVECVEGGGIVVLLLRTMKSLKQLYTMAMDVHSRFRTSSHQDVVPRFNERFILSLTKCASCLVVDDELNVLPVSRHASNITPFAGGDSVGGGDSAELRNLKASLADTQPVGTLVDQAKTLDQAQAIMTFVDAISEKTLRSTVALTAARGRGKSAALGISIAGSIAYGYSNVFVTAPSPENLTTVFDFIFKGFDALKYKEHLDYEVVQSTNPEFNKAVVRVNIFRDHRQTIQYIHPSDHERLSQAELLVIDEAAAIPLPLVKKLLGNYLVFMSSTINGYEGTGRSLSLKLLSKLREEQGSHNYALANSQTFHSGKKEFDQEKRTREATGMSGGGGVGGGGRTLRELELKTPIRYSDGDKVEAWLHELLCLDATSSDSMSKLKLTHGCPHPSECELFCVNRDALFSYHKVSEAFLQRMMALYVASHYKNSPNDLLLLSDAPAHRLFVLLGPNNDEGELPDVLCVVQVALEGAINQEQVQAELGRGKTSAGNLIPWTLTQQYQDHDFASLTGGRVVRIATHPDVMSMGYGSRAVDLLTKYYQGETIDLDDDDDDMGGEGGEGGEGEEGSSSPKHDTKFVGLDKEKLGPRKHMPPLLEKLSERPAERLHYLGVSYGLTHSLYKFWKRKSFSPVYLRQTPNNLTGEFSCIMLRPLRTDDLPVAPVEGWLWSYRHDFMKRFAHLLGSAFRHVRVDLSLSVLDKKSLDINRQQQERSSQGQGQGNSSTATTNNKSIHRMTTKELEMFLSTRDLKRLEAYSKNMVDNHMVLDLIPIIARLFFFGRLSETMNLSSLQCAILLGLGLQSKTIDDLSEETTLPAGQLLAMFNKSIRKISKSFKAMLEEEAAREVDASLVSSHKNAKKKLKGMTGGLGQSLENDLNEGANEAKRMQERALAGDGGGAMKSVPKEFMEYAVPEGLAEVLAGRKSKKLGGAGGHGMTVSVKRKRDEAAEEEAAEERKKQKEDAEANKKRRNKMKKQKKKNRDKKQTLE